MLVARTYHRETELVRWLLLIALAAALATFFTARIAGAGDGIPKEPNRLPTAVDRGAEPITAQEEAPADFITPEHAAFLVDQLKSVIAHHENLQTEEAANIWREIKLPKESAVWRELGLTITSMRLARLDDAALAITRAEQLAPENPLVYYFRGVLYLEYAYAADEYYDAIGDRPFKLASHRKIPTHGLRQTKSMYELMATQDLEKAIDLGGNLFRDETLLPSYMLPADNLPPTVGELLHAWRCDNFAGKAHAMLGTICLEKGLLEQAEQHLDQATEQAADATDSYRELGVRYETEDRHGDAVRAYAKAFQANPSVAPSRGMLRNLGDALGDLW